MHNHSSSNLESFFDILDAEDFREDLEIFDFFKVPSVECNNFELINYLLSLDKPLLVSTGTATSSEIEALLDHARGHKKITIMHCISNYPIDLANSSLGFIKYLIENSDCDIGYSSHDSRWEVCVGAIAMGVTLIERHITFSKKGKGLDHSTSSTPQEMMQICEFARNADSLNSGSNGRVRNSGEQINRQNLGRSPYATKDLFTDSYICNTDVVWRSPQIGLSRNQFYQLQGKTIKRNIPKGSVLSESDFADEQSLALTVVG